MPTKAEALDPAKWFKHSSELLRLRTVATSWPASTAVLLAFRSWQSERHRNGRSPDVAKAYNLLNHEARCSVSKHGSDTVGDVERQGTHNIGSMRGRRPELEADPAPRGRAALRGHLLRLHPIGEGLSDRVPFQGSQERRLPLVSRPRLPRARCPRSHCPLVRHLYGH